MLPSTCSHAGSPRSPATSHCSRTPEPSNNAPGRIPLGAWSDDAARDRPRRAGGWHRRRDRRVASTRQGRRVTVGPHPGRHAVASCHPEPASAPAAQGVGAAPPLPTSPAAGTGPPAGGGRGLRRHQLAPRLPRHRPRVPRPGVGPQPAGSATRSLRPGRHTGWLETTDPANPPIYERFGFETVTHLEDAAWLPGLWVMRREPASQEPGT
jgi:hypothetical protein